MPDQAILNHLLRLRNGVPAAGAGRCSDVQGYCLTRHEAAVCVTLRIVEP